MHGLAELVLSLCGLLEAEGRLLRENAFLLTRRCVIMVLGLLFGAGALACMVAASYEAMLLVLPKPVAIAIAGVFCAIVAAVLLWCAREKCETDKNKLEHAPKEAAASRSGKKQDNMGTAAPNFGKSQTTTKPEKPARMDSESSGN